MQDGPASIQPATIAEVVRFRYHHGANLGSVFILEKWLTGCMFEKDCKGSSEHAAAEYMVEKYGMEHARNRFEKHWREYVSDADLDWLRDVARCTTVRLPIGYFTLGSHVCQGTQFNKVGGVYDNAWSFVKELVQRCNQRGIGVLIDLHGLPGGANCQEHSGTNSGKAEFWHDPGCRDKATKCLVFIAQEVKNMEGVAGVQIINEADWNAHGMYEWYDSAIDELANVDPTIPIYVSDAWNLKHAISWVQAKNRAGVHWNPIVIDTHLYWCFGDENKKKSPQQISKEPWDKLGPLRGKHDSVVEKGAASAVVGEYSCVLGEETWANSGGAPKEQMVREFGNAQSRAYQAHSAGCFFWTYRMDWMPGGEWGFKQMTEQQAIVPPPWLTISPQEVQQLIAKAQGEQGQRKEACVNGHIHWWDTNHPGQYEHWRYEQGWDVGYADAMAFFSLRSNMGLQGGDKIGMFDLWVLKRLRDSGQGGKFVWEFETGLRQGVAAFYDSIGMQTPK
ncbi:glycoside hydrolase family 5 protein [Piedraia hortae CBS 480.64]|uniref:Glycoside hydrolase family 5 protein n=1 Tax=Piedraia hortae CBS 480.64 TaxID=1314780 RepID=A0A6A7C0L7_9PEZI|nr:glycoside hydrolase family 5 protein [Piedraia hortae CBS 480.64]